MLVQVSQQTGLCHGEAPLPREVWENLATSPAAFSFQEVLVAQGIPITKPQRSSQHGDGRHCFSELFSFPLPCPHVGRGKGCQVCLCCSSNSVTPMTFKFYRAGTEGAAAEQASLSAAIGRASWSMGTVMRPGRPLPRLAANKAH